MVLAREIFGTVRRRIAMPVVNRPEQKDQTANPIEARRSGLKQDRDDLLRGSIASAEPLGAA
jgi:hypothetical protein